MSYVILFEMYVVCVIVGYVCCACYCWICVLMPDVCVIVGCVCFVRFYWICVLCVLLLDVLSELFLDMCVVCVIVIYECCVCYN